MHVCIRFSGVSLRWFVFRSGGEVELDVLRRKFFFSVRWGAWEREEGV